jgi:hypothetical protein
MHLTQHQRLVSPVARKSEDSVQVLLYLHAIDKAATALKGVLYQLRLGTQDSDQTEPLKGA